MAPSLSTHRLLLQPIQPNDQQFVFEGLSHPEVIPFYGVRYSSFAATKAQMDWYEALHREGTGTAWKMVHRQAGEAIGVLCVYYFKPEHKKAEVGFWLLPKFWHQGFALEAMQAAVDYWKNEKALHRLEAFVEAGNEASCKLLEKPALYTKG